MRCADREIEIYSQGDGEVKSLVICNGMKDEGKAIFARCQKLGCHDFILAHIAIEDWNRDLSPWPAPPVFGKQSFAGKADDHLKKLKEDIVPFILEQTDEKISSVYLAGYSLAGLFALYSAFNCDLFDGIASVSGSLWYPDLDEYIRTHKISDRIKKIYFSLGDKENKTKNPLMATVADKTEMISQLLSERIETIYEINEGDHFKDPDLRVAKGIRWLLRNPADPDA
ncbi:MAG: hypothetical protein IJI92_10395 [Erysipelotrichaceae bacterium]|nr:hypothetical protein [Erysipelotrichaceae bacterium]